MNRKIWIGSVAVFVTTQVIEGFLNLYILGPVFTSHPQIWRPPAEMKLWILPLTGMFFSFFFVFIFSRGYEGKGLLEGVRYGLYVALLIALPTSYGNYAMMQIPPSLAAQWFTFSALEYVIAGAILSGIFQLRLNSLSPI